MIQNTLRFVHNQDLTSSEISGIRVLNIIVWLLIVYATALLNTLVRPVVLGDYEVHIHELYRRTTYQQHLTTPTQEPVSGF